MDRRLRQLERRALSGDPQAKEQLTRYRERSGQLVNWGALLQEWLQEQWRAAGLLKVPFPTHDAKHDEAWLRRKWPGWK